MIVTTTPEEAHTVETLLDLCYQHHAFVYYYRGRWFIALGEIFGFGKTLPEAIENWCQAIEQSGLVEKPA